MKVAIDLSSYREGLKRLDQTYLFALGKSFMQASGELLRLSVMEVPHDTGALQGTGVVEPLSFPKGSKYPEGAVSYNTPYAWRLHEHPEYHFQKSRKGKYLEDPAKKNLSIFREIISQEMSSNL